MQAKKQKGVYYYFILCDLPLSGPSLYRRTGGFHMLQENTKVERTHEKIGVGKTTEKSIAMEMESK